MLLIGSSGTGKSTALRSIIHQTLQHDPDEVRLLLIADNSAELGAFAKLPHSLTSLMIRPVLDEYHASSAIGWAHREHHRRLDTVARASVASIDGYNRLAREDGHWPLPHLLIAIDDASIIDANLIPEAADELATRVADGMHSGIYVVAATHPDLSARLAVMFAAQIIVCFDRTPPAALADTIPANTAAIVAPGDAIVVYQRQWRLVHIQPSDDGSIAQRVRHWASQRPH